MLKQSKKEPLLHIATFGKSVGIRGDIKFHLKTDFPEQFVDGASFLTNLNTKVTLKDVNLKKGTVKIDGINTLEDVKKFTNAKVLTTREETRKNCHLEDGEFFWFDLEDCEVYENNILLGIVYEVERFANTNYLNVITDKKLVEAKKAKKFLIPFQEPFIVSTDIEKKVIIASGAIDILDAS